MNATWERVEEVFAGALAQEESERLAWVRAACADEPAVLHEVEAMLTAHARPLHIEPRLLAGENGPSPALTGAHVGPYRLREPLGHGGMGSVWLAERADGVLDRTVAIKIVHLPFAPDAARMLRQRFEAERRILARLEHPGIVRLLEAGTAAPIAGTDGGYPYFAMDYVAGQPITTYADERGLGVAQRLRLFVQVCDAVHHAHQRLVIHRDLKPSNILVTDTDEGLPQVKLLDFGIARLLDDEHDGAPTLTETGLRPMTRAYAAPEQIRGEPATTATDVYALGVVLCELLTGHRPFDAPTPSQLERAILTDPPTRPSSALAAAPTSLVEPRRLRGDLDAVVLTALRKEPEARYASAEALAADVHRHLDGLPVSARVPSPGYRLRSFVRRHRTGVSVATAALALLVAFTVVLAVQQRVTMRERDTARATADFLEGLFGAADPLAGERLDTLRITDLLDRGVERTRLELANEPLVRARLLYVIGRAYVRLAAYEEAGDPLTEAIALARVEGVPATLAGSLTELAATRNAQWQLDRAEPLVREALTLAEHLNDLALTVRGEHVLALTLLNAGRPDEAEALLNVSITRQRTEPYTDETALLMAEQTLARALFDQGRLDEAERLLLALRERHARRFGQEDARLIGVLNPLTFLYLGTGRLEEAEAMGAEATALMRSTQPGSSTLSQTLATYAAVYRRQGRLEEAEALLHEALQLPAVRPGAHAIPMGTLASVLYEKGDLLNAVEAQESAVDLLREDTTPAANAATLSFSLVKLAGYLEKSGQLADAEAILLTATDTNASAPSDTSAHSHTGTLHAIAALVEFYERRHRLDEAATWRERLHE